MYRERHPLLLPILMTAVLFLHATPIWPQESSSEPVTTDEASPEPAPKNASQEIAVGADRIEDGLIEKRLEEVFRHIPALANIQIEVDAGVVRLAGQTISKEAHEQALELTERVEGVVSIKDEITRKREIRDRLTLVRERLLNQATELVSNLPLLIIALTIFFAFWILASFISRWDSLYEKFTPHVFLQSLLRQIIRGAILFIGFIVTLEILDATALLGTIVGVAGVMGLAIGFALRDTVENYIASILLSIRQPFRPFDHILLENYEGLVMKLTSRETILMTLDGNHVRIPNATVYKGIILNYSRNPKRRFTFEVGIDTSVNIEAACQLAIETLRQTPGVIPDPPVQCVIEKLGDSNVILQIFAWTTQDRYDFQKVKSEAIRAVKTAFDQANYDMPEPIYRLRIQGYGPIDNRAGLEPQHSTKNVPPAPQGEPSSGIDVSKDHHIAKQISHDREDHHEMNLLNPKT